MADQLTGKQIRFLMRANRKTIAGVAAQWNLSAARVRAVRARGVTGAAFVRDWLQICGVGFDMVDTVDERGRHVRAPVTLAG